MLFGLLAAASVATASQPPVLTLMGAAEITVHKEDFGKDRWFEDQGAVCTDPIFGDLNSEVKEHGDEVDLHHVQAYTMTYSCKNKNGVAAVPVQRVVRVVQQYNPGDKVLPPTPASFVVHGRSCRMRDYDCFWPGARSPEEQNGVV